MSSLVTILRDLDGRVVVDVVHHRTAFLNQLMILVTRLGDGWAWALLGFAILFFDGPSARGVLLSISIGLMLDIPLYNLLKKKFSRPRPYQVCNSVPCVMAPPDRFSFPSGHTSVAFVVLIVAGAAYSWLFAPLALLAVLIGVSRVYLGVHYPTDVLAGSVLGTACGMLALWLI